MADQGNPKRGEERLPGGDPVSLYRTEGIVLKTRNLGEADRIVTLYSPDRGKIRAVARGARRPRSRFVSSTQMFAYADFLVFSGRSLDSISQVETKETFARLHEDLARLAYASYAVELVDEMIEEGDKDEQVFGLVLACLRLISDGDDPEMATRGFEVKLATALGYEPVLDSCASCGARPVGQETGFAPGAGGVVCGACLGRDPSGIRVSRGAVELLKALSSMDFAKIGQLGANPGLRREIEKIMRMHLDFRLDRRLRSLDFIEAVRAALSG